MKIAIVTGASSGMGKQFVLALDKQFDYDEIWVIARREERLAALQKDVKARVRPIPMDLTEKDSVEKLSALQARFAETMASGVVDETLDRGREYARAIATETYDRARRVVGLGRA